MSGEKAQKIKYLIIIVSCLALAGIIAIVTNRDTIAGARPEKAVLMLCENCGADFELSPAEFSKQLKAKGNVGFGRIAFTCPKCGEEASYTAHRCPNCEKVFALGSVRDDYSDRCPYCGYSEKAEKRGDKAFRKLKRR